MKLTRTSLISATSLLIGGFIGASALVTLAQSVPGWTPAPAGGPPNNNAPAPINVTSVQQSKSGWLAVGGLITNGLFVNVGSTTTLGSILMNDGAGNASWTSVPSINPNGLAVTGGCFLNATSPVAYGDWGHATGHVVLTATSKSCTCNDPSSSLVIASENPNNIPSGYLCVVR